MKVQAKIASIESGIFATANGFGSPVSLEFVQKLMVEIEIDGVIKEFYLETCDTSFTVGEVIELVLRRGSVRLPGDTLWFSRL